jgi:hypothetical protein
VIRRIRFACAAVMLAGAATAFGMLIYWELINLARAVRYLFAIGVISL